MQPENQPGALAALGRTMDGINQRSPPDLDYAYSDPANVNANRDLAIAALSLPWPEWHLAFGRLRPRSPNPLAWIRFALTVRAAKREIRRSLAFRYGDHD